MYHAKEARDFKRIFDNDEGENTGGVGCYSPSELFNEELKLKIGKNERFILIEEVENDRSQFLIMNLKK